MRRAFHASSLGFGRARWLVELTGDVCAQEIPDDRIEFLRIAAVRQCTVPSADGRGGCGARKLVDAEGSAHLGGMPECFQPMPPEELKVARRAPGYSGLHDDARQILDSTSDTRWRVGAGGSYRQRVPRANGWTTADVIFAIGSSLTATPYGQRFAQDKFLIHSASTTRTRRSTRTRSADIGLRRRREAHARGLDRRRRKASIGEDRAATTGVQGPRRCKTARRCLARPSGMPYLTNDDSPLSAVSGHTRDEPTCSTARTSVVTHDAGAPRATRSCRSTTRRHPIATSVGARRHISASRSPS